MTMPRALIMQEDANGHGAAGSPWESYLFARGGGREEKKKTHPNKINHDSWGREEDWGRGKAAKGLRKASMRLFTGVFSHYLRDHRIIELFGLEEDL